ncbi:MULTISPECIES: glycerol-3-phosphate dehydrogenase/oxidase [unclassified Paenibacillus]|uniref:glycerol-3-phosphate dehydrogenase/oxidase n=1 Tax=unclassified Paenibacillus TaxID=185978 RepID=UPI001AE90E56|nr:MULTISPECIES: glycerol-3-phosphate dehydrogenase/oxidase [unclassified Paenibacillus]MBP1157396.1 glycerol-3-phosphate dehydrogenase [Paenibacillus sp. PvP091]MBP1171866.1 glycerol-3-phosphate dehydrogenase [Paenibacillus sp. PvR098]MBP2438247.1 glycerol-3-phosphate dehydrogenase [Paenibacillus sp. PvP052]
MTQAFSSLKRDDIQRELEQETYDMLVIGGGITGAGIALDGAVRGLKVALIEMQDFAAGTSSRSTKLVHGGLRYLKQGEVKLVREVGRERAIVHENAQHVVIPEWMLMPIIKGGTYGKLATSVGLYVYDWLAGVKREERRKMLSKSETIAKEPLLWQDKLLAGGYYVEYRTDDARLTIEIMKAAVDRGAKAVNYTKVTQFLYENGKVTGVQAEDQNSGRSFKIRASRIVNAAGPWVDTLRELDKSKQGKRLHLTKGVHIVVDQSRFPLRQTIYFDTPDGRMVFAVTRDGKTYIGTTDTNYEDNLEHPRMTKADLTYLLAAANYMFPTIGLTEEDVEASWAGLRPLIHEDGKSPSELSRKDEIFLSPSGLITIAGGKLTGYRKMAERVVDLVTEQIGKESDHTYPGCSTDQVKLSGGDFPEGFDAFAAKWTQHGIQQGLSEKQATVLVRRYGSNVPSVYGKFDTLREASVTYGMEIDVLASLVYSMEEEMVTRPLDFLNRRTGAVNFDHKNAERWLEPTVHFMRDVFEWDDETALQYLKEARGGLSFAKEAV